MSSDTQGPKGQRSERQAGTPAGGGGARRGFLLGAGAAVGAAGVAAATLRKPAATNAVEVAQAAPKESDGGQGYRLTAHIRKYYDTTKV
ncbi:MAG: formate dehydrogenase [Lautropia sp.]